MSDVLETLLRLRMKRFDLTPKLGEANTIYKLIKWDLDCKESLLQID